MISQKIGVIGCGNMGSAIVRGLLKKGVVRPDSIFLNDKEADRSASLAKETGALDEDLCYVMQNSDLILITVKPQDFAHLAEGMAYEVSNQTIVSIMAGVKINTIVERMGKEVPVARAMPNMGAFVGEGVTCLSYNPLVKEKQEISAVFSAIGEVLEVDETAMDAVTAVSGSGPAYLFYLAQAMTEAGQAAGLNADISKKLVEQTLQGAAKLLKTSGSSAKELISKVASKGGTTESALSVFDENGMKNIIKNAVLKAKKRSEELSGG
jgi:pyrroline-5-carboxylate reductase